MKYSKNTYMKALAALAALRTTLSEKEQHTVDFVVEAITEKADKDTRPTTRADRFRAMSDEDLAVFFAKVDAALYRADLPVIAYRGEKVNENLDWLRKPCEEANDGPTI